jgi:hypothetical protein
MPPPVLSRRELNRALLARQLLLERARLPAVDAVARLVGLQSQVVSPPFVGLWTRLHGFRREELAEAIARGQVVRATMMRSTLHLVTAVDYRLFRLALQPALRRAFQGFNGPYIVGLDLGRLVNAARERMREGPIGNAELRDLLVALEPERAPTALMYGVRSHLPMVQVPTGHRWGHGGAGSYALAEDGLVPPEEALPELVRRYLAAFGPASVADAQTWAGLAGLRPTFEALRPELRTFRDEKGVELFDVADGPLPPAETAAPVRFMPEYDNLLIGHADRSRVLPEEYRKQVLLSAGRVRATFLVDGFVAGAWRAESARKSATLVLEPFAPLEPAARAALDAEGERLLRFLEPAAASLEIKLSSDLKPQP